MIHKIPRAAYRMTILAALALMAGARPPAMAQVPVPGAQTPAPNALRQIRGFSIQLNDPNGYASYIKAVDDLADMGCTSVNFVIAARQRDVKAESIHINYKNIPLVPDIERILTYAKSKGMYVMLMPIVLLDNAGSKEWRGVIAPPDWDNWFESYDAYIVKMAALGQKCKVDLFCVGSELLSTEPFKARWTKVITDVRKNFKGKLTYSANWDHYDPKRGGPTFWDQLDYLGMNNYNELAKKPGVPVPQLVKNWEKVKTDILTFVEEQKKPFFFSEVGWHNLQNTLAEPWNYVADGAIDLGEQERAYKSFVEAWRDVGTEKYMGAFVWEWRPGARPTDHGQYSLQGSPALDVVKKWMKDKG